MLSMQQQISVSVGELRYVGIECPNCHAKLTLDLQSELGHERGAICPDRCPICRVPYDSAIPTNVSGLWTVYRRLLAVEGRILFTIERPTSSAAPSL